jgi:hypothetical protein
MTLWPKDEAFHMRVIAVDFFDFIGSNFGNSVFRIKSILLLLNIGQLRIAVTGNIFYIFYGR